MTSSAAFLLACDAFESRPWAVYVNGSRLVQANGTNPRIKQVSPHEALTLSAVSDRVLDLLYLVRIVKTGIDPTLILPSSRWQLSFDGGATLYDCRCQAPIRERGQQGDSWLVYLERLNRSQGTENAGDRAVVSEESSET